MTNGTIARALMDIGYAYYRRTGKNLQEIVINEEVYEALRQELYCELDLDELPSDIKLHGMSIRKE